MAQLTDKESSKLATIKERANHHHHERPNCNFQPCEDREFLLQIIDRLLSSS